jgi:eukaryotic-like serine/threonine-protein kinase
MTQIADLMTLANRYRLLQTLGVGGMATVYQAQDLMLERTVAIKILRQDFSQDNTFRERFRLEAKAAANLSHPNIVTIHDIGFDQGKFFIVMEYVPGTDLKTIIRLKHRIAIQEAIPLMIQACAGIGYAHRAGLVHCDVKPHNMLVTPDQRLKVTDFGIARALATILPDEKSEVVWGSPLYFSPEQAAGLAPSPASDVYSLGVILYEMVTGQLPFQSTNGEELARMHREVTPVSPKAIVPEIPEALDQIIMKVLSKEPSGRYRTADQLGRVLATYSQQGMLGNSTVNAKANPSVYVPALSYQPIQTADLDQTSEKATPGNDIDWGTISLSLLALLTVGGLIPLWLYIVLRLSSVAH